MDAHRGLIDSLSHTNQSGEHRLDHNCANSVDRVISQDTITAQPTTPSEKRACSFTECTAIEKITSLCPHCAQNFCLAHRHAQDHNCDVGEKLVDAKQERREEIASLVQEKMGSVVKEKKPVVAAVVGKKKVNYAIELMKMKSSAKGESSIPTESRVYLRIHFPCESALPSQALFFHKDWPVGKLVDKLATVAKVSNVNNTSDEAMKLVLYNAETGDVLPMNESLAVLISGKKLQQASGVKLERVSVPFVGV
ncbi:AN1-type zinc finger protein 1 [Chytriomyces hyalinus]|nr:AN1-type zinc finger protein 1 [Chytriomyces hyalinus]